MHRNGTAFTFAMLLSVALIHAQTPPAGTQTDPDFSVRVYGYFDSDTLQQFGRQLQGYLELRDSLQAGLPVLKITIDPDEIERAEKLLAKRLRRARREARQGDVLAPPLQTQVKQMFVLEVDARTLAAIMDDNPGEFRFTLNGTYPKNRPLSTVPPKLLMLLPALENDVEYRFIGRHLILRDVRANIVIDTIPYAIHCHDCLGHRHDDDGDDDDDHDDSRRR